MESIIEIEDQLDILDGGESVEEELGVQDDDYDDDDDDDDDEVDNRRYRFERAYQVAKSTDMQGYKTTLLSSKSDKKNSRSIQDLTALSWAYFSTEENLEDVFVNRLRAVECDDLCQRLQI